MNRPPLDLVMRTLRDDTRPAMRARFNANSCVAATKVVVEVARAFGYRAKSVEVEVAAYNAKAWQAIVDGHGNDMEDGSKIVAIEPGDREDPGAWPGAHMVALVAGDWFVDLSLDQMSRPDHDLPLEAMTVRLDADNLAVFIDGGWVGLDDPETGSVVTYRQVEERAPYRDSPDWAKTERTDDLADVTCRLIAARAAGDKTARMTYDVKESQEG